MSTDDTTQQESGGRPELAGRGASIDDWPVIKTRADFERLAKEDPYTSAWKFGVDPREIFDIEVVEADARMTWGESYIGTSLGSVTDYGRHWDLSDQELIEKEIGDFDFGSQFLGFMDDDKEKVAETILIVRKENGYVKTAGFGQ